MNSTPNDDYVRRLLAGVASGEPVSQRSLARDLGVALGLTNLLVRRLVRKGWIRTVRVKPNRWAYLITPAGIAEKARVSREYFQRSVGFYVETRDRIRQSLELLAAAPAAGAARRVVFLGAGDVAEVGFVVLAETPLQLVGIVDDERTRPFFGLPVHPLQALTADGVAGEPYDMLLVMSFGDPRGIRQRLAASGIPDAKVHWLEEAPQRARTTTRRPAVPRRLPAAPPPYTNIDDPHQSSR